MDNQIQISQARQVEIESAKKKFIRSGGTIEIIDSAFRAKPRPTRKEPSLSK